LSLIYGKNYSSGEMFLEANKFSGMVREITVSERR
jgi:hypothetical protein